MARGRGSSSAVMAPSTWTPTLGSLRTSSDSCRCSSRPESQAFGADTGEDFTRRYAAAMPAVDLTDLPCWDLEADRRLTGRIGEWGLDEATQKAMHARRETFVAKARLRLSRG
jgi:hypothetical protein